MLRELLTRVVSALVRYFYLDLTNLAFLRLEIHRLIVLIYIILFLLLDEHNISLCYTLSVIHTVGELYSLFLAKRFISVCRRLRQSLVLGYTRFKPLKELEEAYLDALVV